MRVLKKISLVYTLQVFAVIILFFSAGSTSANKTKEPVRNIALPFLINKSDFLNSYKDSSLTEKTSLLWKSNISNNR